MDLIRPAASPLEAASRLISGKLSADDPNRSLKNLDRASSCLGSFTRIVNRS